MKKILLFSAIIVSGLAILYVVLFLVLGLGSGWFKPSVLRVEKPPGGMSPKETVEYYFKQWNDKNEAARMGVVCEKMRGGVSNPDELEYVKLLSCEEEKDPSSIDSWFDKSWYSGATETAMVNVEFEVKLKEFAFNASGLENGTYPWQYYLAKDKEHPDWMIVMYGAG